MRNGEKKKKLQKNPQVNKRNHGNFHASADFAGDAGTEQLEYEVFLQELSRFPF